MWTALKEHLQWCTHHSHVFIPYIHLYCLLLHVQHCHYLLVGKVTNKIQESLQSKEYYQEDTIKWEKWKNWAKISPWRESYFKDCPGKFGQTVTLPVILTEFFKAHWHCHIFWKLYYEYFGQAYYCWYILKHTLLAVYLRNEPSLLWSMLLVKTIKIVSVTNTPCFIYAGILTLPHQLVYSFNMLHCALDCCN